MSCVCLVPKRAWTVLKESACGSTLAALRLFFWHWVSARAFCDGYFLVPLTSAACLPFLMHNFLTVWNLHTFWTDGSSQGVGDWLIFSYLHFTEKPCLGKNTFASCMILLHRKPCLNFPHAEVCLACKQEFQFVQSHF